MKKRYSILIVPEGGQTKQFSLSKATAVAAILFSFLLVSCSVIFSVDFFGEQIDSYRLNDLTEENTFLAGKIEVINQSIDSLRNQIVVLTHKEETIRTIFDLPQIDPQQRQLGYGGPEMLPADELYTPTQLSAYQAEAEIDRLLTHSAIEKEQFANVYQALVEKKQDLDHTPSITPTTGWHTRGYGIKADPFTGQKRLHAGIDISNNVGTPIVSTANGVVKCIGNKGQLGKTVVIDHGNGYETVYGHVSKYKVKQGQVVKRGELIALMGNSGRSTGPHLHYGVLKNGHSINPKKYIYSSDYLLTN
ncbi:MAG: M23 family metallopeptidase [candidate division Zixibacteria bacterium]|nr:M23 family metallopeptidase [candidate division Zixibacteria bacterium]